MINISQNNGTSSQTIGISEGEKETFYRKEKESRVTNRAIVCAPMEVVAKESSVVGSQVVYRRNEDGLVKARNVPWGLQDTEKDNVQRDALSMNTDSMRLVMSLAVKRKLKACKMDVRCAYLQAKEFNRDKFVRSPPEEKNSAGLWKLLVPAYGLTDSGRLLYLTSYEDSYNQNWILQCFCAKKGDSMLLLVVQTDDYLYARSMELATEFEISLQKRFMIGSTESTSFRIIEARVTQEECGRKTLSAKEKLEQKNSLKICQSRKKRDRHATKDDLASYG